MPNKFGVEYVARPGAWPFMSASWSCFEELCGWAFSTAYVTSLCQSVCGSAVWIQAWRAPCPHSDTTRFWPFPVFLLLAASRVLWPHWVLALVWDTLKVCNPFLSNCPGRPPETRNTFAITYHVHVPHAHWPSLGLTATATAVAWTITEVRACSGISQLAMFDYHIG